VGQSTKFGFLKKKSTDEQPLEAQASDPTAEPYFAEHERSVIRVKRSEDHELDDRSAVHDEEDQALIRRYYESEEAVESEESFESEEPELENEDDSFEAESAEYERNDNELVIDEEQDRESAEYEDDDSEDEESDYADDVEEVLEADEASVQYEEERYDRTMLGEVEEQLMEREYEDASHFAAEDNSPYLASVPASFALPQEEEVAMEPEIEPSMKAYLDSLRAFDSHPRRGHEPKDPRADFVVLLSEMLDILREQVNATSAMFFWVNTRKQQLVLESAALDDRAYQNLAGDRRFPIELDAVSRIVSKRKPELHSIVAAQAELDLIPYYREPIGIRSFAGMPVLFGDGLVAVLTVDSTIEDNFSQETLRMLTSYSKVISGLIKSYIEKYDLISSSRTLESARKLHQIVSPDTSHRVLREQRKNPDYILRALTEAASEILDWDWLSAVSFDENRRLWGITSLQSRQSGAYVPPQTPISLDESIVGKCLMTGRSSRVDNLTTQSVRFNLDEDRTASLGHSFMVIPIRTANKNYGALAIEHSERARYTDADVETLEHLARSAASALEIIALSEIVNERALTDLLTASLNKRGLLQRLNEELARAMEYDEPLTLVLFEIDGSADLLSRFSQEESDTIVLAITRLLRFGARAFDVVARVGEHAFAAVLIKMTDEDAYLWSEKMRKMIVSEVIAIGKRSFSVTVSIGVSGARRDGTVEELIEGAELAIERAKELGGNTVIVF
jgi:diguanylate cyclase (GGDEF)-like protein